MSSTQILNDTPQKILVLGSGNFGSCLADHLADSGNAVLLWSRSKDVIKALNEHHQNPKYLTDHVFSANITAIGPELPGIDVLRTVGVVLFAIPTQNLRYDCPILPISNPHMYCHLSALKGEFWARSTLLSIRKVSLS